MSFISYYTADTFPGSFISDSLKENFENLLRSKENSRHIDQLAAFDIKQIAIGPTHVGILTSCGKICRIANNVDSSEVKDPPPAKIKPSIRETADVSPVPTDPDAPVRFLDTYAQISERNSAEPTLRPTYLDSILSSDAPYILSRRARASQGPTDIPERLIQQVENILQGRSRAEIIRSLMRSNLNVNGAVNRLLNQDDTGHDNFFSEPVRGSIVMVSDNVMRTIQLNSSRNATVTKPIIATEPSIADYHHLDCDSLKWWDSDKIFTSISSMYSDLVAIDADGNLHQWCWACSQPTTNDSKNPAWGNHNHPKAETLNISGEVVVQLSCSFSRGMALLKSNKIIYWMDSALWGIGQLEGSSYISSDLKNVPVRTVNCNNLYSVALLEDGSVWWWGVLPFSLRNKTSESKSKKINSKKGVSSKSKINVGSYVEYRSKTYIHSGATAYYFDADSIKMGRLVDKFTADKTSAKFVPLTSEISTSDSEIAEKKSKKTLVRMPRNRKRKHSSTSGHNNESEEQEWPLSNVVFITQKVSSVGVVIKIDKENVLVEFTPIRTSPKVSKPKKGDEIYSLKNSRIFNIKDLKLVKRPPKVSSFIPNCQLHPRKLEYPKSSILGIYSTVQGVYILSKSKDEQLLLEYIIPSSNLIESHELIGSLATFGISNEIKFLSFKVFSKCLAINVPGMGVFILKEDELGNYSPAPFPSMPNIKILDWSDASKDKDSFLVMAVINNPSSLSNEKLNLDLISIDQSFYLSQNIIHFISHLFYISEVSFTKQHHLLLLEKLKNFQSQAGSEAFKSLLVQRDLNGLTPFLYSVKIRSYRCSVHLYQMIKNYNDTDFLMDALFPSNLPHYLNPIYLLCTNETCSFSWTGLSHQNQDVYECRTCGITDKLCCCSECAYTCHRGHECVRKPRSPTAFCDCWEKCICQSIYNGEQGARKELFRHLISHDRLLSNIGVGSDHVMLFIIRTMTRHNKEAKNFKHNTELVEDTEVINAKQLKRSGVLGMKIQQVKLHSKFLAFAIKSLLGVKQSVYSLFTSNTILHDKNCSEHSENASSFSQTYQLLPPQLCGRIYDCFIFNLFTRCDKSVSKVLYNTLKEHFSETSSINVSDVLVNFIKACARVYISIISSMSPFLVSDCARRYSFNNDQYRVLYRIIFFFKRFPITAVTQLSKMAFALISPVIYGNTFHKNNSHCLYTKMSDLNEFLGAFFSTSHSFSSISNSTNMSYYTRPTTLHNHPSENILHLEGHDLVHDDVDEYYSGDEIDDASDGGDNEYAVVSDVGDFNEDHTYTEDDSLPSNSDHNFSEDDFPTVIDSNYHSNPSSESDQNSHDDGHNRFSLFYEPISQHHEPSPFNILHRNELRPRSSNRTRALPPNYQWAIRNGSNSDSARDSLSGIRSATSCDSALNDTYLMISLQSGLARSFMLIVKLISDLCFHKGIFDNIIVAETFNSTLGQAFLWMFDICESSEAKLKFGMKSLNSLIPSLQPGRWDYDVVYGSPETRHPEVNSSTVRSHRRSDDRVNLTNSQKNRNDFLGNLISILRSSDNDHFGILPYLDLTAFKHIAYMLDGFIYFLFSSSDKSENNDLHMFSSRLSLIYNSNKFEFVCKKFFTRTSSTLTFGHQSSGLSSTITEALPLAVYPSILTSLSSKKDLFSSNDFLKDEDSTIVDAPFSLISSMLFTSSDRHSFISKIIKSPPISFIIRWNNLIDVFSQIFSDSIGVEASTIYQQFSRFEAKEFAFRLYIERIKGVASNELSLINLDRIHSKIIVQTFKILNTQFSKRQTNNVPCFIPPFSRIKALFRNEPGEGSGVTRNFFAFICQAITSSDKLPDLSSTFETGITPVSSDSHSRSSGGLYFDDQTNNMSSLPGVERLLNRLNRLHAPHGRGGDSAWSNLILQSSINRQPVNSVNRTTRRNIPQVEEPITLSQLESMNRDPESANSKQLETRLSLLLKKKVTLFAPEVVNVVVEALLQLSPDVLFSCMNDNEYLKTRITLILKLYGDLKLNTGKSKDTFEFSFDASVLSEDTCLFFQPGKPGFYFPTNAKKSFTRLNAYKNVGRIIGLAFYFNEVIPLVLCRPVIKFLLGHPLSFHDFAFYDPIQYESLRMLTLEAEKYNHDNPDQEVPLHGLNFCLNVVDSDENPHTVDLMPSGSNIPVTSKNVNQYVQAYVEYLILFSVKPELTAMRDGIHEVLHPFILQSLNPEDFRLLLNGSFEVSVAALKKIVTFTDETSGLSADKIERYKKWFWSVIESLNATQKGELLQFWTSSPQLSEIETTPKPNVTIKAFSNHLPTSNTCVMRLYLPAYKKKSVLKSKILLAIKTRTFGFI